MIQQLEDLSEKICGTAKKKGPGRGRGRWKRKDKGQNGMKEPSKNSVSTTENSNSTTLFDVTDAALPKFSKNEDSKDDTNIDSNSDTGNKIVDDSDVDDEDGSGKE